MVTGGDFMKMDYKADKTILECLEELLHRVDAGLAVEQRGCQLRLFIFASRPFGGCAWASLRSFASGPFGGFAWGPACWPLGFRRRFWEAGSEAVNLRA